MKTITRTVMCIFVFQVSEAYSDLATPSDVKDLRVFCQSVSDTLDNKRISNVAMNNGSYCLGLIQGVVESMLGFEAITKTKMICLNGNETYGQFAKVFLEYSDNHPEEWNKPASRGVMNALYDAFRCDNK